MNKRMVKSLKDVADAKQSAFGIKASTLSMPIAIVYEILFTFLF